MLRNDVGREYGGIPSGQTQWAHLSPLGARIGETQVQVRGRSGRSEGGQGGPGSYSNPHVNTWKYKCCYPGPSPDSCIISLNLGTSL